MPILPTIFNRTHRIRNSLGQLLTEPSAAEDSPLPRLSVLSGEVVVDEVAPRLVARGELVEHVGVGLYVVLDDGEVPRPPVVAQSAPVSDGLLTHVDPLSVTRNAL